MASEDLLLQAVLGIGQNRPPFDLLSGFQTGVATRQRDRALGLEERDVRIRERRFDEERRLIEEEVLGRQLDRRANEERLRQLEDTGLYEKARRSFLLPEEKAEAELKTREARSKLERFDVDLEWEALLRGMEKEAKDAQTARDRAEANEANERAELLKAQRGAAASAPAVRAATFGAAMKTKLNDQQVLRYGPLVERLSRPYDQKGDFTEGGLGRVQKISGFMGRLIDRAEVNTLLRDEKGNPLGDSHPPTEGVSWTELAGAANAYLHGSPAERKAARADLERIADAFEKSPGLMATLSTVMSGAAPDTEGLGGEHRLPPGAAAEILTDPAFLEEVLESVRDSVFPRPVPARVLPGAASRPAADMEFTGRGWAK